MIDHKNKIIFIHLEKSGGSSIEQIFTQKDWWFVMNNFLKKENYDNGREKHVNLKYAKIIYKKEFKLYKKICIVRHPYSLFISKLNWYNFEGKINAQNIKKMIMQNEIRWKIKYLHEFLGKKDNYDFIIRFENYKKDYYKMLETFNFNKDIYKLKYENKRSDTDRYKGICLTKEAKELIKKYSEEYCKIFNYKCKI